MPLSPDALRKLQEMPVLLREAGRNLSDADLRRAPSHGGFSLVEQACHLRDLEGEGYLVRIERILREEHPFLEDFDGMRIAAERNYRAQDFAAAVNGFERSRSKTVELLSGATDEQLNRAGEFGSSGRITLRELAGMMAEHDAGHRGEIEELLAEIRGDS